MKTSIITRTQREILIEVAAGKVTKEIAVARNISVRTVECHTLRMRQRLQAQTLAHAVFLGIREGLIPLAPLD